MTFSYSYTKLFVLQGVKLRSSCDFYKQGNLTDCLLPEAKSHNFVALDKIMTTGVNYKPCEDIQGG